LDAGCRLTVHSARRERGGGSAGTHAFVDQTGSALEVSRKKSTFITRIPSDNKFSGFFELISGGAMVVEKFMFLNISIRTGVVAVFTATGCFCRFIVLSISVALPKNFSYFPPLRVELLRSKWP